MSDKQLNAGHTGRRPAKWDEALAAVRTLIRFIGDDPTRPGLSETPGRVLRAWWETWGKGYYIDEERTADELKSLFKLFDAEGELSNAELLSTRYNEMVFVRDIAVNSHCEHHMTPFWGMATIAYLPSRRGVIGLSKLARVVDHFARRLQVQECLTVQVADALAAHLSPHAGVMLNCSHFCMISRGIMQPNITTQTTALRGLFMEDSVVRAEFLNGCHSK